MKPPLIGTGFYASATDHGAKEEFFHLYWKKSIGDREFVVVDNSEIGLSLNIRNCQLIRVDHNLGHVGDCSGRMEPHLLGWSMSWIIPALIAYSERRDFFYVEQDVLAFGEWEKTIITEAQTKSWYASIGKKSPWAVCEQSLFWLSKHIIARFVGQYMSITDGDGVLLPEHKFAMMQRVDSRIGTHSLGVGRMRPITPDAPAWYVQQLSAYDLITLIQRGIL